ncbi:C-type lectin domain family 2 member D-like [Gymnogyps californianus]|uniref:C-type lectin domain family 2 member D-like n=1 Tax=Gymnogyps californianus TaxID=33616 RepID=UPI0021C58267|nr:C-type lectin domain family 2 member D-like [Gymnogyps californianus]XP_050770771.1 C-type lectin domain family 2 member D-like [Gymnogyps californianus]XP_050770772.1 C-type lectin domain family 2 member D-like [Gymnogyps californianus]
MGKGAQKPNSSEQEEVLNHCNDIEKDCKWESNTKKSDWERFRSSWVFTLVCVVLVLLVFVLLVALTVVHLGYHLPRPDFFYVCPDAWLGFQGKCYYFSEAESNWTTSQESCEALGASLALISTREELTFIKRYKGEANHWFGLRKNGDSWWWTNGMAFDNWFEVRGGGPCAYLNQERISSSLCHTKKNWLCSRPDDYVLWKQKAHV